MNGINLNGFGVRSFMTRGLTAKWGIGENRVPPIWDTDLIGYWDARGLPDGEVRNIANKATLATKAPAMQTAGATMADGTLQYDGVDDRSTTAEFVMPEKFTVFWDVDWLGDVDTGGGITMFNTFSVTNKASTQQLELYLGAGRELLPNTVVGMRTDGKVYNRDGSIAFEGLQAGTTRTPNNLFVGHTKGANYTQLGFRQLLIFNKELSQAEVNEVLTTMFPV